MLPRQLRFLQPEQEHAPVSVDDPPYGRLLSGIRGLHLHVFDILVKLKFDYRKPREHRLAVGDRLKRRDQGRDRGTRTEQSRRLHASQVEPA